MKEKYFFGCISDFDPEKKFGYLKPDLLIPDSKDIYFISSEIAYRPGQKVKYRRLERDGLVEAIDLEILK